MTLSALLFDLDGTLLDTAPALTKAMNIICETHNQSLLTVEELRPHISKGTEAMLTAALHITPTDKQYEDIKKQFLQTYTNLHIEHTLPYSGWDTVCELIKKHNLSWGIVTNKAHCFTLPLLQHFDLVPPSCLVCGDTLKYKKPHPAPLLHACQQLKCRPRDTVYVGDALTDLQAAHRAGMTACLATYGYDTVLPNTAPKHTSISSLASCADWIEQFLAK